MVVGNWGSQIIFETSDQRILTFQGFKRTAGSDWAKHSRMGAKDQMEWLRPKIEEVKFDVLLRATLGVRPREMLDLLALCAEQGCAFPLVIGGKRVGRYPWSLVDVSETWERFLNHGELVSAKVELSMAEYV